MEKSVLKKCVVQSLEEEQIKKLVSVNFDGASGKTDGYLGDLFFCVVKFISNREEEKEIYLAVKTGKWDQSIREQGLAVYYKQELIIYSTILPALKTFQIQKQVKNVFDGVPKCFKTFLLKDNEVIVMENLKHRGCVMPDKKIPLSYPHLKLLLEEFGKFHAISFAYHDQRKEEFEKMVSDLNPLFLGSFTDKYVTNVFDATIKGALKIFQDRNEPKLYEQFRKYLEKDIFEDVKKLNREETSYRVISHRDSWNNNFMFLYENNDQPTKALIIDWQTADVANTPIHDLSHLLYTCSPVEELDNLENLLKIYYEAFSSHLKQLGSNPEELFSFAVLKDHWRKFSKCSIVYVPYIIKQCYWNAEEAPTLDAFVEKNWLEIVDGIVIENEDYYKRLIGIMKHFLNYKLN